MKKWILILALFVGYNVVGQNCEALLEAIRSENIEKVQELIKTADPNCIAKKVAYEKCYVGDHLYHRAKAKAPLMAAARKGNLKIAKMLVKAGGKVDLYVDGDGNALLTAARYGHLDFVKYLINRGVNPKEYFPNYGNALISAC